MSRYFPVRKKKTQERTTLIEKGSTDAIKVDKDEIERIVVTLRDNYETSINDAPKNLVSLMDKLRTQAKNLTGTDTYEDFYKIIMKHFGDIKIITPGTIGAFCYGCSTITGFTGTKSCSATCIGSIPTPDMPNWIDCDSNVFILYLPKFAEDAKWKDLHTVGYDKLSYIFIITDNRDMKDLDLSKIKYLLQNKGITKYCLYHLISGVYKHISTGIIKKKQNIGTWGGQMLNNKHEPLNFVRQKESNTRIFGLFLFFFLLVVIAVAAMGMRGKRRKN